MDGKGGVKSQTKLERRSDYIIAEACAASDATQLVDSARDFFGPAVTWR
jgi:hypothetical protein